MNPHCDNWRKQLTTLQVFVSKYKEEYRMALKAEDRDTAFAKCRELKDKIMLHLSDLQDLLSIENRFFYLVDGLSISENPHEDLGEKIGLKGLISKESYEQAVQTALDFDENISVPSREEVIKALMAKGPETLKNVMEVMEQPGLIIVPNQSILEMVNKMEEINATEGTFQFHIKQGYKGSDKPGKCKVCVIDMKQHTKDIQEEPSQGNYSLIETYIVFRSNFQDHGLDLSTDLQYTVAMRQSVRRYNQAKQNREESREQYLPDYFYNQGPKSATMFRDINDNQISWAYCSPFKTIQFLVELQDNLNLNKRGRAVLEFMEF